jgi:predicted dehydrogenase
VIKAAIIGYGRSGSSLHADAIEKNKHDFEVAAVCDPDESRLEQARERFGCKTYTDYRDMLRDDPPDLASVVSRSDQHCEMACDCLDAGANTLVTKPWAVNADEAQRMVDASAKTGKLLFPWLPARWEAMFLRLRELVQEGVIGRVFLVRRTQANFSVRCDWQTERRCGGGYLLNWGPHVVDPPILLLGGKPKIVYGRMAQTINPGDVEDLFLGVITLDDGTIVHAEYTIAAEPLPNWFIQGTEGTIAVHGDTLKLHRKVLRPPTDTENYSTAEASEEETREETIENHGADDAATIYADVARAIRGEQTFAVSPENALELSRVLDAIAQSSDEDRVVAL